MILRRRFSNREMWFLRAALLNDERVNVWACTDPQQPEWLKNWKGSGKWGVLLRAALHSACCGLPHRVASLTMFERTIQVFSLPDTESSINLPFKEVFKDPREALKNFTHRVGRVVNKNGFMPYYPYIKESYTETDVMMARQYLTRNNYTVRDLEFLTGENMRGLEDFRNPMRLKVTKSYNAGGRRHETTFRMHSYHCSILDETDKDIPGREEEERMHYADWRKALKEFSSLTNRR